MDNPVNKYKAFKPINLKDIKGIISFIPDIGTLDLSIPFVQSSSLNKMISDTESKKILWKKLKEIILK